MLQGVNARRHWEIVGFSTTFKCSRRKRDLRLLRIRRRGGLALTSDGPICLRLCQFGSDVAKVLPKAESGLGLG
jgi:hypothetical protein